MTLTEYGRHRGVTQQAISKLKSQGRLALDPDGRVQVMASDALLSQVLHPIKGGAGGSRATAGALAQPAAAGRSPAQVESLEDMAAERSRLLREQRIKLQLQNAVTLGELAPKQLLSDVLARTLSRCARLLDTIPGELRRLNIGLSSEDIEAVRRVIAKVRNVCAATTIDDLFQDADGSDDSDAEGDANA